MISPRIYFSCLHKTISDLTLTEGERALFTSKYRQKTVQKGSLDSLLKA